MLLCCADVWGVGAIETVNKVVMIGGVSAIDIPPSTPSYGINFFWVERDRADRLTGGTDLIARERGKRPDRFAVERMFDGLVSGFPVTEFSPPHLSLEVELPLGGFLVLLFVGDNVLCECGCDGGVVDAVVPYEIRECCFIVVANITVGPNGSGRVDEYSRHAKASIPSLFGSGTLPSQIFGGFWDAFANPERISKASIKSKFSLRTLH